MPSCKEVRAEQQRSRRQQFGLRNPWNSPGDIAKRAENLSRVHKSRLAHMVKQCIMCGANELTNRMTDAIRSAFKKHPSLINYEYRKCHPTFRGMPKVFDDMEKRLPQRVMANMRERNETMAWDLQHVRAGAFIADPDVRFTRVLGYDSRFRAHWPDYRRTPFSIACAFDRTKIVHMLVTEFDCTCIEEKGLKLIDEHGVEHEWLMTGFDLAIEFGCVATFKLLRDLSITYPHVTKALKYAEYSQQYCLALCYRNVGNYLFSHYNLTFKHDALVYALERPNCGCDFCMEGK